MSSFKTAASVTLCLLVACVDGLARPEANQVPIAVARVEGQEGSAVTLAFVGTPVQVTLDASGSIDPGGPPLAAYRWLSGKPAVGDQDAGMERSGMRWVPAGADEHWPEDVEKPVVELDEGEYVFVLWVIDQQGLVSDPSTLRVTVATPLDPPVQACVDGVLDGIALTCKSCVCGVSDACRAAAVESACGANCWGLIGCIRDNCPDYVPGGDLGCVVGNCMAYLGGAMGSAQLAPCLAPCADTCSPK